MPAGVGAGRLWALVREARSLEQRAAVVAVSGGGAATLAAQLAAGGEAGAVRVGGATEEASVALVVLDAPPTPDERQTMRRAARAAVPLVVVRTGELTGPVPYALPTDVVDAASPELRLEEVVTALVTALGDEDAVALAGRLPVLREAVRRRLIGRTALLNAAIAAAPWLRGAHFPLIALAQCRMQLGLGVAAGKALPHDPQQLAAAVGPSLTGTFAAGLALRGLYRRLPVRGPLAAAGIAYAGTRALGACGLLLSRPSA